MAYFLLRCLLLAADPLADLDSVLADARQYREVTPATLHALVGLDLTRRGLVETLLRKRFTVAVPQAQRLHLAYLLVELGGLSPTGTALVGEVLAAEVGRPTLARTRVRWAQLLARLDFLPPRTTITSLVEQVRQTEDAALLQDQVEALLALRARGTAEDWRFVAGRVLRALKRDVRAVPVLAETCARVVAEAEQRRDLARAAVPVLVAALARLPDADVVPLAEVLAQLALHLSEPEVAELGAAISPRVATCYLDTVRVGAMVNDMTVALRWRERLPYLVARWRTVDAARVAEAFAPEQVTRLQRPNPVRGSLGPPTPLAEAAPLLVRFWASLFAAHFLEGAGRIVGRGGEELNPRAWQREAGHLAWALAQQAGPMTHADAVALLGAALRHCPFTPETHFAARIADALVARLEELEPAACRQLLRGVAPVLARFAEAGRAMAGASLPHGQFRSDEFLRRLEVLLRRCGAVDLAELRVRLARCVLDLPGDQWSLFRVLLAERPASVGVALASGGGVVLVGPEPGCPTDVSVALLAHPQCVGPFRHAVLQHLQRCHGRRFGDHWAFLRFAAAQ